MRQATTKGIVVQFDDIEDVKVLLDALQFLDNCTELPLSQRERQVKAFLQTAIGKYEANVR